MKTVVVLATVLAAALALPGDTYNHKYDNFNAEDFVKNPVIMTNYMKCFLHMGPCPPEAADFRKVIPEALRTGCAKCTPKQKPLVRTVVFAFQSQLPDLWEQLVKQEDPTGEYKETFERFLKGSA